MSEPRKPPPNDQSPTFEELANLLWALRVHAENGQGYADLHDTGGLHYALKSCDAVLQRAVHLYNEVRGRP